MAVGGCRLFHSVGISGTGQPLGKKIGQHEQPLRFGTAAEQGAFEIQVCDQGIGAEAQAVCGWHIE